MHSGYFKYKSKWISIMAGFNFEYTGCCERIIHYAVKLNSVQQIRPEPLNASLIIVLFHSAKAESNYSNDKQGTNDQSNRIGFRAYCMHLFKATKAISNNNAA